MNFRNTLTNTKDKLIDALLGQKAPATDDIEVNELLKGVDTSSPYYLESMGEEAPAVNITASSTPRMGGILPDLASGFKENYVTGFAAPNWGNNQLDDGRNKGFAYRLGEGLGTVGRFMDSPLGRGLLAAGLNSALGYNNSLQEGLTAAVGRQNNQTADRLYRNQLKQMGYSDEQLNGIGGNISGDMYKNLATNLWRFRNLDQNSYIKMKNMYDRQLQNGIMTPEEYKMNIDALNNQYVNSQIQTMQAGNVQESNQTRNTNMNEQLLPYKQYALEMSPQIALGNLGVAQGNLAVNQARLAKGDEPTLNNILALANHFDSLPEVKNFKEIDRQFNNVKNVYDDYKAGKLRANASDQAMITTLNKILDPTSVVRESEFARTAQGQAILAKIEGYAKKITRGGSGLTDEERQDLFNSMQTMRNAAYNTYSTTANNYIDFALRYGINPQDIIRYGTPTNNISQKQSVNEGTIIKNSKTGQRMMQNMNVNQQSGDADPLGIL